MSAAKRGKSDGDEGASSAATTAEEKKESPPRENAVETDGPREERGRKPDAGAVWRVRVVSGMNSLRHFYVQNVTDHEHLRTTVGPALEAAAAADVGAGPRPRPRAGDLIAARCADGSWRRARVKGQDRDDGSRLCVLFVDYAADRLETVSEYAKLPRHLAADRMKPAAHRCYFENLPKDAAEPIDPNAARVLDRYFGETCFVATFRNGNEPYAVKLRSAAGGRDAIDTVNELLWEGVAPGQPPDPIIAAYREMLDGIAVRCRRLGGHGVRVVRYGPIASTEHFYVETARSNRAARDVHDAIDDTAEWRVASRPAAGQTLIARCADDGRLRRARLAWPLSPRNGYRCYLVDRGAFADCSEFYDIESDVLWTAPPAKIHCSLYAARQYADPVWRHVALSFADEMAAARGTAAEVLLVLNAVGSPCAVDLWLGGMHVGDLIRPATVRVVKTDRSFAASRRFTARLNCAETRRLCDALATTKNFRPAEDPRPLDVYVAELAAGRFRRVRYVGESSSSFAVAPPYKVLAVDDPRQPMGLVDQLFELPKSVADVHTAEMHCTLAPNDDGGGGGTVSADKFFELCDNGDATFQMVIVKNDHANGHLVRLFWKSKDVSTIIEEDQGKK